MMSLLPYLHLMLLCLHINSLDQLLRFHFINIVEISTKVSPHSPLLDIVFILLHESCVLRIR
eukprot:c7282_g1_i1 orf=27-212(+)